MVKLSVIILAGGFSERFGQPKPFLQFDDNVTFLEKLVSTYSEFGVDTTILVANVELKDELEKIYPKQDKAQIQIVWNCNPQYGRFYSIKLGAEASDNIEQCFIQNVDNPFTDIETLNMLYKNTDNHAFVSPLYNGKGGHPILVPQEILEAIRNEKDISINTKDFLARFARIKVTVSNRNVLANINTPDDYKEYFKIRA
jgi:molybdenum cofactor cytidylyltransferase